MPIDGFFIHAHTQKLNALLTGLKIEKIYQINAFDLYITFRGREKVNLLISANPSHPKVFSLQEKPETPLQPPMFCMLMRKHLTSGIVQRVEQIGLERIITFYISSRDEFGEIGEKKLTFEIMGKHTNLILLDGNDQVIDAIKRVYPPMSVRTMAPGVMYTLPPSQKTNPVGVTFDTFEALVEPNLKAVKWLYTVMQGISPILAKGMFHHAGLSATAPLDTFTTKDLKALHASLTDHIAWLQNNAAPYLYEADGQAFDFSAVPLKHLENEAYDLKLFESFDDLLSHYYASKTATNTVSIKASHLIKSVESHIDKLYKKIDNLQKDLDKAAELDTLRLYGELLTANLHLIKKGMAQVEVLNYYDNTPLTIPLDVTKQANENAQRYYKRYNKSKVTLEAAEKYQIEAQVEIDYLEDVKHSLITAETLEDIDLIREELVGTGYSKRIIKKHDKQPKKLPPHKYKSTEGVVILVGRNNLQNDELTLKKSNREHIWLHTKDTPGSHVIIQATFPEIEDATVVEAAMIAAYHSKARLSSQVAVDFTEVKFVKKPKAAKPGRVIYEDYKTIYVTPDEEKIKNMRQS